MTKCGRLGTLLLLAASLLIIGCGGGGGGTGPQIPIDPIDPPIPPPQVTVTPYGPIFLHSGLADSAGEITFEDRFDSADTLVKVFTPAGARLAGAAVAFYESQDFEVVVVQDLTGTLPTNMRCSSGRTNYEIQMQVGGGDAAFDVGDRLSTGGLAAAMVTEFARQSATYVGQETPLQMSLDVDLMLTFYKPYGADLTLLTRNLNTVPAVQDYFSATEDPPFFDRYELKTQAPLTTPVRVYVPSASGYTREDLVNIWAITVEGRDNYQAFTLLNDDGSFVLDELIDGELVNRSTGTWAFDEATSLFTYDVPTGGSMQGYLQGAPGEFYIDGTYATGNPAYFHWVLEPQ